MNTLKECINCPVKCGGDCAMESWKQNGNLTTGGINKEECDANRWLLTAYLKHKLIP